MGDVAAGAVAGTVATVPMSAVMWAAQQVGLIHKQPPEEITEAALNIMPPADEDQPGRPGSMAVAHVVFGAALAAVLARLRRG